MVRQDSRIAMYTNNLHLDETGLCGSGEVQVTKLFTHMQLSCFYLLSTLAKGGAPGFEYQALSLSACNIESWEWPGDKAT